MRLWPQRAVLDAVEGRDQQTSAGTREPVQEIATGIGGTDRFRHETENRAGIQSLFELERGCPGHVISMRKRVLHGSRPPPSGQQREVQVDPAKSGDIERGPRNQCAIGDHRATVGIDLFEPRQEIRLARSLGLEGLDTGVGRTLGYGRHCDMAPAARRCIGAGDYRDHFMPRCEQRFERGKSRLRRAHEDDPHRQRALPKVAWGLSLTVGV